MEGSCLASGGSGEWLVAATSSGLLWALLGSRLSVVVSDGLRLMGSQAKVEIRCNRVGRNRAAKGEVMGTIEYGNGVK